MRVLVIDDDPDICTLMTKTFERWGHEVDCLTDGDKVVPYCVKHLTDYDVVLLDVVLPGIPGTGLYRWLRNINDEIRVILITGYGKTERVQRVLDEGAELLPKPFDADTLHRVVIDGEPALRSPIHNQAS